MDMADRGRKRKQPVVCLSSSSTSESEGSQTEEDSDYENEVESISDYSEEADVVEATDDVNANESSGGEEVDEESQCKRVIRLLEEGNDLQGLLLKHCKAYLRKYGLRLAGTKEVCVDRIKEHWRIKDGNGEIFYPRSSFGVNCKGDVCKGDVVLFTQKVYEKFNKVTRHGKLLGRRSVAGRVVKESYGSARQQHTFTVEVLWSKGVKQLPPLFPLLVKGRNLYKLTIFRQLWNDEAERLKVLAEKHNRGATARRMRAKKSQKMQPTNGGVKHWKRSDHTRTSQMKRSRERQKSKHVTKHGRETARQLHSKGYARFEGSRTTWRDPRLNYFNGDIDTMLQTNAYAPVNHNLLQEEQWRSTPHHFSEMGSTSMTMTFPPNRTFSDIDALSVSRNQAFNQRNSTQHHYCSPNVKIRNLNRLSDLIYVDGPLQQFPQGWVHNGQRMSVPIHKFSQERRYTGQETSYI